MEKDTFLPSCTDNLSLLESEKVFKIEQDFWFFLAWLYEIPDRSSFQGLWIFHAIFISIYDFLLGKWFWISPWYYFICSPFLID